MDEALVTEHISSVEIEDGVIYIATQGVDGEVIYVPALSESGVSWSCKDSTIQPKYFPEKYQ